MPLDDFRSNGRADIQVQPSTDWQTNPDGSYSGSVALQLDLTNSTITPAIADSFNYELKAPSAADVRRALDRHSTVTWTLEIKDGVDANTRALFLAALDGIRLSVNTKEAPVTAASPYPNPNAALEEEPSEAASQD